MLNKAGRVGKLPGRSDGKDIDTATAVVCHQHVAARLVYNQVAGPTAPGGLLIQEVKLAAAGVDREGTDRAGSFALKISDLTDTVEEFPAGVNGEEGWVARLRGELQILQLASGQIKAADVDPLALATPGIGTKKNKLAGSGRLQCRVWPWGALARAMV